MSEPKTTAGRLLKAALKALLGWDEHAAQNAVRDIEVEAIEAERERQATDAHEGATPRDCPECIRLHG